ncbi:MAG: hypothetical protein JWO31_2385, partial [Phycisphaerales bacterium]|nr:hypothetical protein [Phycisphaerales bacterium]
RAVVRRAGELGITIAAPPARRAVRVIKVGVVVVAAAVLVVIGVGPAAPSGAWASPLLGVLVVVAAGAVVVGSRRAGRSRVGRLAPVVAAPPASPPRRSIWVRRLPGSLAAVVGAVGAGCYWRAVSGVPARDRAVEVLSFATAYACGIVLAGMAVQRTAAVLVRARHSRGHGGRRPGTVTMTVPMRRVTGRSVVAAFAVTAGLLGAGGGAAARWQERRAVARFDAAGYGLLEEVGRGRYRAIREEAVGTLAAEQEDRARPSAAAAGR